MPCPMVQLQRSAFASSLGLWQMSIPEAVLLRHATATPLKPRPRASTVAWSGDSTMLLGSIVGHAPVATSFNVARLFEQAAWDGAIPTSTTAPMAVGLAGG